MSAHSVSVSTQTAVRTTSRNISQGYTMKYESSPVPDRSQVVMKDEKKSRKVKAMHERTPTTTTCFR